MPLKHRTRPGLVAGLVLVAGALVATVLAAPHDLQARPAFVRSCIGYCHHPTNAAKVFRWGREAWRQEFEVGHLSSHWKSNHRALIRQQGGMLTIQGGRHTGTISAWMDDHAARTGRWEARIRASERASTGTKYTFTWGLVPASRDTRCGGNEILLASYRPGDHRVKGHVRTLPGHSFTFSKARDLRSRAWHAYAVEITPRRISWFVDTRVVRTEKRPEALSGIRYRPMLVMKAVPGRTMRPSWLQADWVRYYTLARPDARSTAAPRMHLTGYSRSC